MRRRELVEVRQTYVEKTQHVAMLASALLSLALGALTLWNIPMPRATYLVLGLVLLVNSFILIWTVRRLKR